MKGIILAAGQGKRLRPLTYGIPKPLLPVGGKPVLEYVIENFVASKKIGTIYIAISHMREAINNYISNTPRKGVAIETVTTLGWETGGDIKIINIEKGIREPVVVAYGDIVTDIDVAKLIEHHKKSGKKATVALFRVPWNEVERFGIAKLDAKGKLITEFVEKPKRKDAPTNLANAGYYVLEPEVVAQIPDRKIKMEDEIFPRLAREGQLAAFVCKPRHWLDIGTLESYRKANRMIEGIIPPEETHG